MCHFKHENDQSPILRKCDRIATFWKPTRLNSVMVHLQSRTPTSACSLYSGLLRFPSPVLGIYLAWTSFCICTICLYRNSAAGPAGVASNILEVSRIDPSLYNFLACQLHTVLFVPTGDSRPEGWYSRNLAVRPLPASDRCAEYEGPDPPPVLRLPSHLHADFSNSPLDPYT